MRGSRLRPVPNLFYRSVGASVVDNHDLVFVFRLAQCIGPKCGQHSVDVSRFVQRRDDEGETYFREHRVSFKASLSVTRKPWMELKPLPLGRFARYRNSVAGLRGSPHADSVFP